MKITQASCSLVLLALALDPAVGQPGGLSVWIADPMEKVLPNAQAPSEPPASIELAAARGEVETGQLVVLSDAALEVRVAVSDLVGPEGAIPASAVETGFVGYVPVAANTAATPPEELVAIAPCEIPDPIHPGAAWALEAGRAQPIWLTVRTPRDAAPGRYEGTVTVAAGGAEQAVPLRLTVYGFEMPVERHLLYTNWCNAGQFASKHGVEMWSEEFWAVFERYLAAMADHRQNILWVDPGTIEITEDGDGFHFDFSRFDRWVETCEKHGVADRIEIQQLGSFGPEGWAGDQIVLMDRPVRSLETGETRRAPASEVLPDYLRALEAHLRERGWLERTLLHIADEPSQSNHLSWSEQSAFVRQYAPGIRQIDAIEGPRFDGLDVWVPKLSHLRAWNRHFQKAQADGAEMWFYTCCHPMGLYPNRFLDYSLLKTRVLHWYNWRYDLAGYLHWGLNFWTDDPFTEVTFAGLPPGDCYIIYPGPDGPLSSIRWDAVRDGIEDYEYLWLLTHRTGRFLRERDSTLIGASERADELARGVVWDFLNYARTNDQIRAARSAIAEEIEALEWRPAVVLATDPPTYEPLVEGPIAVNVRGVVEPGTKVTVGDVEPVVNAKGEFELQVAVDGNDPRIVVSAEKDGQTTRVTRQWSVLRER